MKELLQRKWARNLGLVLVVIGAVYALIYADVVLRARSAYLEGEKYWSWYQDPRLKEAALTKDFAREKAQLDGQLAKGKIAQDEYQRRSDILKYSYDRRREESSVKYAYIWYQTAVELFSPPESKWVRLSRQKMPQAKELWKQELRAKNVPFEEYMLD